MEKVNSNRSAVVLGVGLWAMMLLVSPAFGATIDFESAVQAESSAVTDEGFVFSPALLKDKDSVIGGYAQGAAKSPTKFVMSTQGIELGARKQDNSPFDFNGAWFSGYLVAYWWETYGERLVTLNGFREGSSAPDFTEVISVPDSCTDETLLGDPSNQAEFFPFSFTDIVRLQMTGNHQAFFMDDFVYNETAVPNPGAVWLLGSGLIGIAGFRRKFKQ